MKDMFLNSSIKLIKGHGNYSDEQMEIILYGLEGIYLTFTKLLVLFGMAYVLDIIKEFIMILVSYNIIRSQAFGIHATKSIYCLISSIILFIGGAILCRYVAIPFFVSLGCSIFCVICLLLYAPADTEKRPLVNKKKRKRFKVISCIFGFSYVIFIILFKNSFVVNYLVVGMLESVIMILPITYKIFKQPYNNYKNYYSGV